MDSGIDQATRLMLAEPLNMHSEANSEWLSNYRANLRDILRGVKFKGSDRFAFEDVEFLPEPFAVFQYYRYGVRFPAIAGRQKYCALVVDFGGGTCDVCVIETTQDGDISQSGKNSKPLGASSAPVGGFFVNRKIIEYLLNRHVVTADTRKKYERAMQAYERFRSNSVDSSTLLPEVQAFINNFQRAAYDVERAKLNLCRGIHDWRLEAPLNQTEQVLLPENLFDENCGARVVVFSAKELRDVFHKDVWAKNLSETVKFALTNAATSLKGHPINLVLLSGGSANIGWLAEILKTEFLDELKSAAFLPLEDYQEVVAKGLAVECARRFYSASATGDFESVIYNPLWLLTDIGGTGIKPRRFQALDQELPDCSAQPGLLIGAATALEQFIDKAMTWKMRGTGTAPKQLKYYFLRTPGASETPSDPISVSSEARLNFEEDRIDAPIRKNFDSDLKVRLTIRSDGTACPSFIFRSADLKNEKEVSKEARPFFVDMTAAQRVKHVPQFAYVGMDFGTSNTSLSLVAQKTVHEIEERSKHASWQQLAELPERLPYPLAEPLQNFVSETLNKDRAAGIARQFVEAALTLAFISTYLDHCVQMGEANRAGITKLMFDLRQNSAGPIWMRVKQLLRSPKFLKSPRLSLNWAALVTSPVFDEIETVVTQIAQVKHEKAKLDDIEWHDALHAIGNIAAAFSSEVSFGFFENVEINPMSNEVSADFRVAHGRPPFHRRIPVMLPSSVPMRQPYLFHLSAKMALPLLPFYLFENLHHPMSYDHGILHTLDTVDSRGRRLTYKNCFREKPLEIAEADKPLGPLVTKLLQRWAVDQPMHPVSPVVEKDITGEN